MRVGDRSTNLILGIVTLVLSALVGLVIPLASGGGGSTDTLAWTPPPATATHAATARLPSPTAISVPTQAPPTPTPTRTAQPTTTTAPTLAVATALPAVTPTELAPTPTLRAPVEAPAGEEGPFILIKADQLNLRTGPSADFPVRGLALQGDTFAVVGRNPDSSWLLVCCFDGAQVWLAAEFGALTGSLEAVPVIEPAPVG